MRQISTQLVDRLDWLRGDGLGADDEKEQRNETIYPASICQYAVAMTLYPYLYLTISTMWMYGRLFEYNLQSFISMLE
jgi:hypothetical protein